MVFIPIRLRNQIWDKYHFSGTQLWLRAHGSAEKNNNRAWCARCMDHFERYWNICAKPACDRVHPVAVVTLAACCCSSRPIIGMDEHWTTLTRAAPVAGARLAIRRASFAISDCWQSPQLRDGLDHTPVSRRWYHMKVFFNDCQASNQYGLTYDAAVCPDW